MALLDKSLTELAAGLRAGAFTSVDIVNECYANIEALQPKLNAFITVVDKEAALASAREKDAAMAQAASPLHGIPFVLKDSYATAGVRTTCASDVLRDFVPPDNATVYEKLLDAGAILIGKMNMDAWGHGASSENTDFGPVKNPWDPERSAGGSSGGAAAAIAARMAPFAIGEDTGGSIRNPAAWNNITGLKVTYGRVSRRGCIAYASSFDTVGPMAKTAEDCAVVLETIAGQDPLDATSSSAPVPRYRAELGADLAGKVIGVPEECFGTGLDPEIAAAIKRALAVFEELGATVKEISMPMLAHAIPVYYLIGPSETSSNLARYDAVRYGAGRDRFTEETMRRIMIGTYALSAGYYDQYYKKAQKARTLLVREYERAFASCDALVMPVTPTPPTRLGELTADPLQNLLADIYTVSHNPVGVPSLALPAGFTKSGLPIGMQVAGKMFSEGLLLALGHAYQSRTDHHAKKPKI